MATLLRFDVLGAKNVSGIIGLQYSGTAIGNLIGPVAAGFTFDVTQAYDLPIALSASTGFLAVAVILMLPSPDRWREI